MPVMTIIGCRMFEDEIVHLIENDPELEEVIVVENEDCEGLRTKLEDIGIPYRVLPFEEIPEKSSPGNKIDSSPDRFTLIVYMLELALHAVPENLKNTVYSKVESVVPCSDGVLLFYGLCGNVLGKIETDLEALGCPVSILKEEDGEIVDDCIGAVLGGRKQYLEVLKSCKGVGTFFLTPMWAANWREMVRTAGLSRNPDDIEMSKFVFDYTGYKMIAKVNTGPPYEKNFEACVREFARLFEFEITELEATLQLVENCYKKAKNDACESLK